MFDNKKNIFEFELVSSISGESVRITGTVLHEGPMVYMEQIEVAIESDILQFLPCGKFNGEMKKELVFAN